MNHSQFQLDSIASAKTTNKEETITKFKVLRVNYPHLMQCDERMYVCLTILNH